MLLLAGFGLCVVTGSATTRRPVRFGAISPANVTAAYHAVLLAAVLLLAGGTAAFMFINPARDARRPVA